MTSPTPATAGPVRTSGPRVYLPLVAHIVPTAVIAYGWVIPNGPIAGVNDHTIGFATTLLGTIVTYHAGIRLAHRRATGGT